MSKYMKYMKLSKEDRDIKIEKDKRKIKQLNGFDLTQVVRKYPHLIHEADHRILTGENWKWILRYQPQLIEVCAFDKLNSEHWDWIVKYQYILNQFRPNN